MAIEFAGIPAGAEAKLQMYVMKVIGDEVAGLAEHHQTK
jgi:hypothetical protein